MCLAVPLKLVSIDGTSGVGEFDGVRLNVYTDGEFIGEGAPIEVTRVEGNRIFVREKK